MSEITLMEDFDPERVDGVENPANGINKFLVLKASGELEDVGKSSSFSAEDRREYAHNGVALPDGSYPIPDVKHLKLAIRMVGLGKRPKKEIRAHIEKRARALGRSNLIPKEWSKKVAKTIPQTGDGRGSIDSSDFISRVNEALAALQTSLDELKQKNMLGGGQADPEPATTAMAKEIEDLKKMVAAKQPKIDEERKEDSTGLAGAEKDDGGRGKNGKFVSRKKFKKYQKALKKYKAEKKVDTDPSVKAEKSVETDLNTDATKSVTKPPRSTSFQEEIVTSASGEVSPAEIVRKQLSERPMSPAQRAALGRDATAEMLHNLDSQINLFPKWRR